MSVSADRNLLFGLLALQNGLINQVQLVAAFQSWTLDKSTSLADHLGSRGDLDADDRAAIEALVKRHLKRHSDDVERSLAAVPVDKLTRGSLARIGDAEIEVTLGHAASALRLTDLDASDHTSPYSVGSATSDGQRFRVLRPHARGGLGEVFVALDAELNREVALKRILDRHADDPTSRARFVLEAEVTGGLEHPGIVPVYGLGTHSDGRPYYAMRFIRGDTLKESIAAFHADESLKKAPGRRSLELRRLLRRFIDVCNAIDYAHTRGILHRDIKPANVILGKFGETLVVDWGLAKAQGRAEPRSLSDERTLMPSSASGSAETQPGSAMGTPAYMSPEQAAGDLDRIGPRADVYSLGATLYCILTGKPPLEGDDVGAVLRAVGKGDFPRPRKIDPTIDRALEAVCLKAMALKDQDRYTTVRTLAEDIERWMADEPVAAWREPTSIRARRWMRRNRMAVAGVAAAVLAVVVGLSGALWVQSRANEALEAANASQTQAYAELREANDQATRRFTLAFEAIGVFHGKISEDFLLQQPEFAPLRDRLLKEASNFYQKLEESATGGALNHQILRRLATAFRSLGYLNDAVGSHSEAVDQLRRAVAINRKLVETSESYPVWSADLGLSLTALGSTLGTSPSTQKDAAEALDEAIRIYEALADADASFRDIYRQDLATALETLSSVESKRDQANAEALARRAAQFREEFVRKAPSDPNRQLALTQALTALARTLAAKPDPKEAIAAYERAATIIESHAKPGRDGVVARNLMANIYTNLSLLFERTGRLAEQKAALDRMIAVRRSEVELYPGIATLQNNLGHGLTMLGNFHQSAGQLDDALADYGRAQDVLERAMKAHPEHDLLATNLVSVLFDTARVLDKLDRSPDASRELARGLALFEALASERPENRTARASVADILTRAGWRKFERGDPKGALDDLEKSRAGYDRLLTQIPTDARSRSGLAKCLFSETTILVRTARLAEARDRSRSSLEILESLALEEPENMERRFDLASGYLRLGEVRQAEGDTAGAVAAWKQSVETFHTLTTLPARSMFLMGCAHAALAGAAGNPGSGLASREATAHVSKALEVLSQAVAGGFRDYAAFTTESTLDRLRDRADFQLLMMDMSFPARPFASAG